MDWKKGEDREKILNELKKIRSKDFTFSSSKILGSMCSEPHPIAVDAYQSFIETNIGDPRLFPGTRELEEKVIQMLGGLLNAPTGYGGRITSGGTESNLMALWMAREMSKKREVLVPESAHFSLKKAELLLGIKLITVPLDDEYKMDIDAARKLIGNAACIVGVAGTTSLGVIDPIEELSEICLDEGIHLHIDAAFGGFVIPFLNKNENERKFDFCLEGVGSVSIDSHKMGRSVIPSGAVLVRKEKWLDLISVATPCVSSEKQSSILGTRPGGSVAATYAVMKHLGINGYEKIARSCMKMTRYAAKLIEENDMELVVEPVMNVIGIKVKNPKRIAGKMEKKGWKLSFDEQIGCLRIVIMPHVNKEAMRKFVDDLRSIV